MITVDKSIFINQPVEKVFAFISDPANDKEWQDGVISSEKTSDGPIGVGTTMRLVQKFMGREMDNTAQVTVYEPPNKMCFKTTSGPIQFEACTTCVAQDGGTQLMLHAEGEPGGFFKVAGPLVKGQLEKTLESDLKNLKEVLEK